MKTATLPFDATPVTPTGDLSRFGYTPSRRPSSCVWRRCTAATSCAARWRSSWARRTASAVTQLVQKALDLGARHVLDLAAGHAVSTTSGSRPFYEALGEADNRNRRRHELAQIKNRVMALDFVLACPNGPVSGDRSVSSLGFFDGSRSRSGRACPRRRFRVATEVTQQPLATSSTSIPIFVPRGRQDGTRRFTDVRLC